MALVRLVTYPSFDDHPRPQPSAGVSALWRRVIPVTSGCSLWLYEDGTVLVKDHLPQPGETIPHSTDLYGDLYEGYY